jgi:hypothetical protein
MSEWLRPLKILEHVLWPRFDKMKEAERQLYWAVIRGRVRARHGDEILGPEQREQIEHMTVFAPYVLPPDIEVSVEDVEREVVKPLLRAVTSRD